MKRILASLVLMVLLFPVLALGETMNDLFYRDGLYFNRSTNVLFTGNITGEYKSGNTTWTGGGTLRNGKKEGPWVYFYDNGQLMNKENYKDGKRDGPWVRYWDNGQLWNKGNYKDGKVEGPWVYYSRDGSVSE